MYTFTVDAKGKVSQKKLDLAMITFFEKLAEAQAKGSTGSYADAYEVLVRHVWRKSGVTPADVRVHKQGEADARGASSKTLEIKTGNGIIGYTRTETIDPDFCKLDKFVAYCAKPSELRSMDDVLDKTLVFTRDEFLMFVATCGLKRSIGKFASGCKLGVNSKSLRDENKQRKLDGLKPLHDCICLQPAYLEARWSACRNAKREGYMTLRMYLEG